MIFSILKAPLPTHTAVERHIEAQPSEISVVKSQSDLMDGVLQITYGIASHHEMASHSTIDPSGGGHSG